MQKGKREGKIKIDQQIKTIRTLAGSSNLHSDSRNIVRGSDMSYVECSFGSCFNDSMERTLTPVVQNVKVGAPAASSFFT